MEIEVVEVPWFEAKEKLQKFQDIFLHEIVVNDYRDCVEKVIKDLQNPVVPEYICA